MKKFGMVLAFLAALLFSGPVMAEYEMSPWKDSSGKLGEPSKSWRIGDIDTLTVNTDAILPTGSIGATENADVQRSFPLYLSAGMQDGGNDLDDGSTPTLGEVDNVPCLVWDDSTETTAAQWTFRLPPDFVASGACGLYALVSSDEADGTNIALDYSWWVNNDDVGFDQTAIAQDVAACSSATLDASNEVIDLSANSTAIAAFTAGTWVTVDVFNASSGAGDTTELKGLEFYYQSTQ